MKRPFILFLLLLTFMGSVAAKPVYDIYHDFKGKVLLIENTIENCTEIIKLHQNSGVNTQTSVSSTKVTQNSATPKEGANEMSDAEVVVGITFTILMGLLIFTAVIMGSIFAILFIFKYDTLKNFFNKRAGTNILGRRNIRKEECIAALGGAVLGVMQWIGALAGTYLIQGLSTLIFIAIIIYLFNLRKQLLAIAPRKAVRWMIIYKLCTLLLSMTVGSMLSVVAIGIFVISIFSKGLDNVWKQEFSFKKPSNDGSGAIRRCCSCQFWDSGHCNFHNIETPANGGCGE